jgi:hypothetical protein
MWSAVKPGAAYFALVFLAGFVLGTVRVLLLAPRLGTLTAVLLELPVILTVSWFACGWISRRFSVPAGAWHRLRMGAVAFFLLIAAEIALAAAFGRAPSTYLASLGTVEGAFGLAGQILFGLIPLLRARPI